MGGVSQGVQEPGEGSPDRQSVSGSAVGGHLTQVNTARDVTFNQQASRPPLPDAATVAGPAAGAGLLGLPRRPAAVFAGRGDALERVHAALTGPRSPEVAGAVITQAAVHGLGGIGKSELALQYAARHRTNYGLVWWIDADTPAQIQTGLATLARALCTGAHSVAASKSTTEEAASWAVSWLAFRTGGLLVFDNVEHPDDLDPYLGRLTGGSVLITTRRDIGWHTLGCVPISVDVLDVEAATDVLAALIASAPPSPSERADLATLAQEVGFLPLALRQAAAFIARTPGMTVPAYRRLLHTSPARAHAAAPAGHPGQAVVAQVWTLTRQRIADLDPLAPRLLALLACYAPDQLPIDVLHHLPHTDEMRVGQALELLASYSMITISPDRNAVSVHRLVQAVTLADLSEQERQTVRDQAADLLAAELPEDPTVIGSWPAYRRLLAHARTVLPPRSDMMHQVIAYLDASGDYTTAKTLQHQRYQAQLDHHGPEHPDTLDAQADLAYYTVLVGDMVAARDQFAALLPIRERVLGAEHPDTLTDRANLAYLMGEAGDVAGARDQFAALLPISERVWGADHPETLTDRANLARWMGEAGDVAGARDQLAALLPIRERVSGAEHPDTLTARANLASWTGEAGDVAGARDQFAALLPIRERVLGAEHPETLTARANLAHWTGKTGDATGARDQFAALLPIRERVLGAEHPDTLTDRANLAYWVRGCGGDRCRQLVLGLLVSVHLIRSLLDYSGLHKHSYRRKIHKRGLTPCAAPPGAISGGSAGGLCHVQLSAPDELLSPLIDKDGWPLGCAVSSAYSSAAGSHRLRGGRAAGDGHAARRADLEGIPADVATRDHLTARPGGDRRRRGQHLLDVGRQGQVGGQSFADPHPQHRHRVLITDVSSDVGDRAFQLRRPSSRSATRPSSRRPQPTTPSAAASWVLVHTAVPSAPIAAVTYGTTCAATSAKSIPAPRPLFPSFAFRFARSYPVHPPIPESLTRYTHLSPAPSQERSQRSPASNVSAVFLECRICRILYSRCGIEAPPTCDRRRDTSTLRTPPRCRSGTPAPGASGSARV